MNLHLAEIALHVASGAHAVVLMDQAGWHLTPKLNLPANISIVAIPSKSPELNPQENVWQFMRDNWLSNRVFGSYDEIVDHCCDAWNKLVEQQWRIMSLGLRDWAHPHWSPNLGIIADLTSGHKEAERAAVCIGDRVKPRIHAAFGAADQPPKIPFVTRRLDAVRCAFK